jgi:hypothetical protein
MNINIKDFKVVNETLTREIEFPFYGWWDNKKERIIKMYPEYYTVLPKLKKIKRIVIIWINLGWNTDARIIKLHVLVNNDVIDNDIQAYFNDYTLKATEAEFLEFRDKAIKELI